MCDRLKINSEVSRAYNMLIHQVIDFRTSEAVALLETKFEEDELSRTGDIIGRGAGTSTKGRDPTRA